MQTVAFGRLDTPYYLAPPQSLSRKQIKTKLMFVSLYLSFMEVKGF